MSIARRRVGLIEWHPTAENILVSAGWDHLVILWNVASDPGLPLTMIEAHTDTIYSMSFNRSDPTYSEIEHAY